tara:strand:- start:2612 stop:2977 length:366 start_codon:yes stop_codon:yes gene_type:complete
MYCENKATVKDYRTWNGQTGSELVCNDCFGITNQGLLERQHEVDEALKDVFGESLDIVAESFLETGWQEMWTTISAEMDKHNEYLSQEFESQTGHEPHEDTMEKWNDNILSIIDKLIKKSI